MMKMKLKNMLLIMIALMMLFVSACAQEKPRTHGNEVNDYVSLVDDLRKNGAEVIPSGEVEQEFFSVQGHIIKVNGQDVQVFEYSNALKANQDAAKVSKDGTSIGTSMVMWVSEPHFYKKGKLIVLYVGEDNKTMSLLEKSLGKQFAGAARGINSFEDCANAGYPVMESYPMQCRTPDGKTFVQEIELSKTIDTGKGELVLKYENGKAILNGSLFRSTPCVEWAVEASSTKDLPISEASINIFDKNKNKDMACIQVVAEPQEINFEINQVSENTKYTVKFDEKTVFSGKLN